MTALDDAHRDAVRRAHLRLRKASQDYEELAAPEPVRGRWDPEPAPPGALAAALDELRAAFEGVVAVHHDVLGSIE